MKTFDDYECEGQMNINEWMADLNTKIPKTCCGVEPWLHTSKCCHWNPDSPQQYQMHYVCPICFKVATDGTEWIDRAHGTYEEAKKQAIKKWNNPISTKQDDFYKKYGLRIHVNDLERFKEQYNIETEENVIILTLCEGTFKQLKENT